MRHPLPFATTHFPRIHAKLYRGRMNGAFAHGSMHDRRADDITNGAYQNSMFNIYFGIIHISIDNQSIYHSLQPESVKQLRHLLSLTTGTNPLATLNIPQFSLIFPTPR